MQANKVTGLKTVLLGGTAFSAEMLKCLHDNRINVSAVFMIPKEFDLKKKEEQAARKYENSNFTDLGAIAELFSIPSYVVDSREGRTLRNYTDVIKKIAPDLILVLGWYYMVPKTIRDLAVHGALGIHASLLPDYAGGSPLVWAIINGETRTGITMFRMEDGVDDGDILAQSEIPIEIADTIGSLYQKVIDRSKVMLLTEIAKIHNNTHQFKPQDKDRIHPLPIRTPTDGLVIWNQVPMSLYNFVRAQTKPYPCAFSYLAGCKIKFVSVALPDRNGPSVGGVVGQLFEYKHEVWVQCAEGAMQPLVIDVDGTEFNFTTYCRNNHLIGKIFEMNAQSRS